MNSPVQFDDINSNSMNEWTAGWSLQRIADNLGCGKSTVFPWKRRNEETGDIERKGGSGRPRATSAAEDLAIRDAVWAEPITTAQEEAGNC